VSRLLGLALCLGIIAWLTASATALRSVSRIWLRHWAERQLRGAPAAELFLERPQRMLLAAGTGVAITAVVAGMIIGATSDGRPWLALRNGVLYALLVLLLGQLVPRAVARRWAVPLVPLLLPGLRLAELALTPLLVVARALTRPLVRPGTGEVVRTEREELEELLREGQLEGLGEQTEIAIISGVVQFGQKTLGDVMTPRADIFAVDERSLGTELASRIAQSGYSRVPICRGSVDQIIGMVHAFDVLKAADADQPPLRPVAEARTSDRCSAFLPQMLRQRRHLAIVRGDDGRVAGLVTLEDLLEELVGDIRDEHDEPAPPAPSPPAPASPVAAPVLPPPARPASRPPEQRVHGR
jgi:putative hemolysin